MKTRVFPNVLAVLAASGLFFVATSAPAQIASSTTSAAPPLPYGVSQILQLEQAKVGDETIIAYIQSSANSYHLSADQIIYLRQQGLSDAVLTAMLRQPGPGMAPMPSTPAPEVVPSTADVAPVEPYPEAASAAVYYSEPWYSVPYYSYYNCYGWPCPVGYVSLGWWGWHGGCAWYGGRAWYGGGYRCVGGYYGGLRGTRGGFAVRASFGGHSFAGRAGGFSGGGGHGGGRR